MLSKELHYSTINTAQCCEMIGCEEGIKFYNAILAKLLIVLQLEIFFSCPSFKLDMLSINLNRLKLFRIYVSTL